jgi:hypothetical protein
MYLNSFNLRCTGDGEAYNTFINDLMGMNHWNYSCVNNGQSEKYVEPVTELSSDVLCVVASYLHVDDLFCLSLALPDMLDDCWRVCASIRLKKLKVEYLLSQLDNKAQSTNGLNLFRNLVLFSGMDQMHLLYNRSILTPIENYEDTQLVISFKVPCSNQNRSIRVIKSYVKDRIDENKLDCTSSIELSSPSEQELIEKLILDKSSWKEPSNCQYRTDSGWKFL